MCATKKAYLINLAQILNKDKSLLKAHTLLSQLAQQQLPEAVQLVQPLADFHLAKVVVVDHFNSYKK